MNQGINEGSIEGQFKERVQVQLRTHSVYTAHTLKAAVVALSLLCVFSPLTLPMTNEPVRV